MTMVIKAVKDLISDQVKFILCDFCEAINREVDNTKFEVLLYFF